MSTARELDKNKKIPYEQHGAPAGMVKNAPHESIPAGAVAYLRNAHAFPTEIQPRLVANVLNCPQPPALSGRTEYLASKEGYVITSHSGAIFSAADVSHYWVWPGDPNIHDEIEAFIDSQHVRVRDSDTRGITDGCWMHAKLNLNEFHETEQRKFYQWGQGVWVMDDLNLRRWTQALCVSRHQPANAISDWSPMDEYAAIGNSNGIFKLGFDTSPPLMWKLNTAVPSVLIESNVQTVTRKYRYDYTYAMSRLTGTGIRDRTYAGVKIEAESGTCVLNPNTTPPRDYGIHWTPAKIALGIETQGRLVGGTLAAAQQTVNYYRNTLGAGGGSFGLTINGVLGDFLIQFDVNGYNVQSMDEVAAAIQDTCRNTFPFMTCEYDAENTRFIMTSGEEDGSTIGYLTAGTGGTDISAVLMLTAATAGSRNNAYAYAAPTEIGVLTVPRVQDEPDMPEQHWTHYTIYRTTDLSDNGVEPRMGPNQEVLPPLRFTWVADVRISGAFLASKDSTGLVTIHVGELEYMDQGTPFRWEDGTVDLVATYIDSTHFRTTAPGEGYDYYYEDIQVRQAAAIGGGGVIRASQTGNLVTRLGGRLFTADDVRKTLTWATGYYSIITEYVDSGRVRVHDTIAKEEQGVTLDALDRDWTDTIPDDTLRNRQGEKHVGLLDHRYWVNMPNINILQVVPGFMITAIRNGDLLYYCQLTNEKKYLAGYYLENRQKNDRISGAIQTILEAPNKFIVVCARALWAGPTNQPDIKSLPVFGDQYAVLYVDIVDAAIGIVDIGSIREIAYGVFEARCTDNTWRQFTAYGFNKELGDMSIDPATGQDRVKRDFQESQQVSASLYGDRIGHIEWLKRT